MMRRRNIGWRVLAPCALVACCLATPAASAATDGAAHNRAAARRAAARLLAGAMLPAGATRVRTDPEVPTRFHWLHRSDPGTPFASNVIDLHAFFRVPGDPASVFRRIRRPHGSTLGQTFHFHVKGQADVRSVSFTFHVTGDPLTQRGLAFQLTAATGGATAVRVEAWAGWLAPRPAFERVPDGVQAVAVSLDGPGAKNFPISTITDPTSVAKLVHYINSLQLVQPDSVVSCDPVVYPRIDVRFAPAVGAPPVARAAGDGCAGVTFAVNGRRGPTLSAGLEELGNEVWKLRAVPACTPGQLSGSATLARHSPQDPTYRMLLRLRNVSQTVCGMDGTPGIQLRGADGQPLPAHATDLGLFGLTGNAAILAPADAAGTALVWGASAQCHEASAATIAVTPPPLAAPITIALGSLGHSVQPCPGLLFVSPVEEALTTVP